MQLLGAFYGVPQSIFLFLFFWGQIIATEAARRSRGGEAFGPIEWQSNAAKNSSSIRRTLQVLWPGFLYVGIFSGSSPPILHSALAEHDVEILIATFLRRSQRAVQQIEALPETPSLPTPCLPPLCLTASSGIGVCLEALAAFVVGFNAFWPSFDLWQMLTLTCRKSIFSLMIAFLPHVASYHCQSERSPDLYIYVYISYTYVNVRAHPT